MLSVAGVLFLGWKPEEVVWLYWLETFIIGAFVIIKLAYSSKDSEGLMKFILPVWMFLAYGMLLIISYSISSDLMLPSILANAGDVWYGIVLVFLYQIVSLLLFIRSGGTNEDVWNQSWKRFFIQVYSLLISSVILGNTHVINTKYASYILFFALVLTRLYWEFRYAKDEVKFEERV